MRIIAYSMMLLGTSFCLVSAIAMLRFPDAYARLHASTKCLTAGGTLVFLSIALLRPELSYVSRLALLIVFFFMSSPVANHAIANAMYKRGIAEPAVVIDEYAPYLAEREEMKDEPVKPANL